MDNVVAFFNFFVIFVSNLMNHLPFFLDFPICATKETVIMSLTNGHNVSKETWDSHNKMMLEPLSNNDSEVCVHWMFERDGLNTHVLETAVMIQRHQQY